MFGILSVNVKPEFPDEQATSSRKRGPIWPYTWLALVAVATVGWLLGLGWAAMTIVRWLAG
jgi:hypothetical protein